MDDRKTDKDQSKPIYINIGDNNIDIRSEEVQEIIGKPPPGLVRWGITVFWGILILVMLLAFVIRYPETLTASFRLTAVYSPQTVESKINGKIKRLIVDDNNFVEQDQILAWMESTANHKEIMLLSTQIDSIHTFLISNNENELSKIDLSSFGNLGDLQIDFNVFEQSFREFLHTLPSGFYDQQRNILVQELNFIKQQFDQLEALKIIHENDYKLVENEFEIQNNLVKNEFLAPIEANRAERSLNASILPIRQIESSIIANQLSRAAKHKEILDLNRRMRDQKSVLIQSLTALKNSIHSWAQIYFIKAPFTGNLVFAGIIQENQTVNVGDELFYIQPKNTRYFGELRLPQQSFGKVLIGQQVRINIDGYPQHEFGSIYGVIDHINPVPLKDNNFFIRVYFPEDLITTRGININPIDGLTGQAEIITKNMSLFERIINNLTQNY